MVASRTTTPLDSGIDLKNPDLYAEDRQHAVFADLRASEPVYWNPEADSAGFWAVTRYEDAVRVVQDPATFSADVRNGGMRIFNKAEVSNVPRPHLLSLDPPRHTELRRALQPLFAPRAVAAREATIRARMTRLIDAIAGRGEAEFVTAIAAPLTLGLLADLLGVPESDGSFLFTLSNAFIGDDDPDYQLTPEARRAAIADLDGYAARLLEERKQRAGNDVVSLLAKATIDGEPLDIDTYTENLGFFLIAGNETTRHSLSAAILALSASPQEKQRLIDDPSLIPSAVKEIVRWATPLMHVRRTAMRDVELGDRQIRKGDKVVVWYSSANRDETVWPRAMEFDVGRFAMKSTTPHLGFGAGAHYCLGWVLAEMQLRIAMEELLRRLPDIRATEPPRRVRSNFIGGIKALNVAFTPEAAPE